MTDDQMDDIKQFFESTIHHTEVRLGGHLDGIEQRMNKVEQELKNLRADMNDGFAGIADIMENQEERVTKLEEHPAAT